MKVRRCLVFGGKASYRRLQCVSAQLRVSINKSPTLSQDSWKARHVLFGRHVAALVFERNAHFGPLHRHYSPNPLRLILDICHFEFSSDCFDSPAVSFSFRPADDVANIPILRNAVSVHAFKVSTNRLIFPVWMQRYCNSHTISFAIQLDALGPAFRSR